MSPKRKAGAAKGKARAKKKSYRRIATEEAFSIPEQMDAQRQLVSDADVLVKHADALVVSTGSDIAATNHALLALAEHALPAVDGAAAMTQDLSQITAKLASPPAELKGKKPLSFGDRLIRLIF